MVKGHASKPGELKGRYGAVGEGARKLKEKREKKSKRLCKVR